MTTYRVEMVKSPDITDAEVRRRLAQVYRLLLSLPQQKTTADRESLDSDTQVTEPETQRGG